MHFKKKRFVFNNFCFTCLFLFQVVVLLTVVSSEQLKDQQPSLQEDPVKTTESGQSTSAPSTEDGFAFTGNGIPNEIAIENLKESKEGNFDTNLDDMRKDIWIFFMFLHNHQRKKRKYVIL